jgi:hypothetical protein
VECCLAIAKHPRNHAFLIKQDISIYPILL